MAGELQEKFGRVALLGEAVEHARVAVDGAVVDGYGGREDDDIEEIGSGGNADLVEYLHEGAGFLADLVPRVEDHQHEQRADVEDQYAPDDLVDGLGDGFVRLSRFAGRDADELDAAEGEHDDDEGEGEAPPAVGQVAAV